MTTFHINNTRQRVRAFTREISGKNTR